MHYSAGRVLVEFIVAPTLELPPHYSTGLVYPGLVWPGLAWTGMDWEGGAAQQQFAVLRLLKLCLK